jgi:hypothetical protein
MSCNFTDLATSIWHDIGEPTDISISYIQSKLVSTAFIGRLNTLLGVCHTVTDNEVSPDLDEDEQGIYSLMYQVEFYSRKVAQLAAGLDQGVISLADGDSRLVFTSVVDKQRLYRDMYREMLAELNKLATTYRVDKTIVEDVKYYNLDSTYGGENSGYVAGG